MTRKSVLAPMLVLALSACAAPLAGRTALESHGVEVEQLAPRTWLISVQGNEATTASHVLTYWHRAAAELALRESCADYEVLELTHSENPGGVGPIRSTRPSAVGRMRCIMPN